MELRRYVALVWRWLWLVALGTALAAGAAYFTSKSMTPIYQANTMLLISQSKAAVMDSSMQPSSDRLAGTYAELLRRQPVLDEVIHRLQLPMTADMLAKLTAVQPVRNTQLLLLSVEDPNPARAAQIANEIPKVFIEQNDNLQAQRYADSKASLRLQLDSTEADIVRLQESIKTLQADSKANPDELDRQQRNLQALQVSDANLSKSYEDLRLEEAKQLDTLLVTEQARPPSLPVRPKTMQNTVLAGLVGLLLALGVAYLLEYLDDVFKGPDEVKKTLGLTTLGAVPALTEREAGAQLLVLENGHSAAAEAYRVLRTNLQFSAVDRPLRSLLITSPSPSEGKSFTAANLAGALAQAGRRVILIDCDLHRPRLHHLFKLPNSVGVTSALLDEHPNIPALLQDTEAPNLKVLTSGPLPPNPAELLGTARMRAFLAELGTQADVVVVDSPPTMALSDAAVLSTQTDAVLLVVDASKTRREMAKRALESLTQVKARVAGVVLNRLPTRGAGSYYYYHYGYNYGTDNAQNSGQGHHGEGKRRPWGQGKRHQTATQA
jgi:capsular exopolysaccharide synthesis family protein